MSARGSGSRIGHCHAIVAQAHWAAVPDCVQVGDGGVDGVVSCNESAMAIATPCPPLGVLVCVK
jgi:hypothetical protein